MKALVKETRGEVDLVLKDIPVPVCPDNGVLLKVRTVSICGSDLHYFTDAEPMPVPQIMGHEFCGDIAEVGKDVKDWNFENDFTPIVQKEHNLIHVAMEDLKSTGAQFVQMSGSGSTLFAVYVEKEQAIAATNKLKEKWHLVLV